MEKCNIIIPSLTENYVQIRKFEEIKNTTPEILNENIDKIYYAGRFPYCIWSDVPSELNYYSNEKIESILEFIKSIQSKIFYQYTNTQIETEHLYDTYSNLQISLVKDLEIYAFVEKKELAEYLKEKYPKIHLIKMAESMDINTSMKFIDYKYYLNNWEKIDKNPNEYIMQLNSNSDLNKEKRDKLSTDIINFEREIKYQNYCKIQTFEESKKNELFVSNEKLKELTQKGIKHYIIDWVLEDKYEFIESIIYYMIKPEFQDRIRLRLIKT